MHLYYLLAESEDWTRTEEALLPFVSEERRKQILSYRFPKDRKQSLYAALLLSYALQKQYGLFPAEIDIAWGKGQKPFLRSHPELHFSIAHSGVCAAAALSRKEIGMDAEQIGKAPLKTAGRICTAQEQELLEHSGNTDLSFFRIWTRKEAYGKYLGTGLSGDVLQTNTLLPVHDRRFAEWILTGEGALSPSGQREIGRQDAEAGNAGKERSLPAPAWYCSVYGDGTPSNPAAIVPDDLTAFFLGRGASRIEGSSGEYASKA